VIAVIPKPKSVVTEIYESIASEFNVVRATRDQVANTVKTILKTSEGKVVLFDIGGWFSSVINSLVVDFPEKVVGVIEDTENGHQKYEQLGSLSMPIYSVARSPLKENEDFLIGQSILFSADVILRDNGKLLEYLTCAVLGYGKIGKSISYNLWLRGVKPLVYDTNPIRRVEAYNKLCAVPNKEFIMKNSDVLFCATGSHSLDVIDFRYLKQGCFIFSVTSSDDELDLDYLDSEYEKEQTSAYVTKYYSFNNHFYLVHGGNAVNFLHKAVVGDFIHLVRAEMMCAYKLLTSDTNPPGIQQVDLATRKTIASTWLDVMVDEPG
jgi:adenosylhomocysteinase